MIKILPITQIFNYKKNDNYNFKNTKTACNVNFTGNIANKSGAQDFKSLELFKNFTIEEYCRIPQDIIEILRKSYETFSKKFVIPSFHKELLDTHDYATSLIKATLDTKWGENNYVFLPIGRSLSSIAKVLGYRIGEDNVKNIPMSNAARINSNLFFTTENLKGGIQQLKKFLEANNLSKNEVSTSEKNYVLADFCVSGKSLKGAEELFKYIWQNTKNLHTLNVTNIISHSNDNYLIDKLIKYLYNETFKPYSFVKQCPELYDINKSLVNIEAADDKTKIVWFKLLDNEMLKRSEK